MMKLSTALLFLFMIVPSLLMGQQDQQQWNARCTIPSDKACIDWDKGVAYAVGYGAPPKDAGARSNPMARRAAKIDAARNVLELIKGVNLDSNTNMENAALSNDQVSVNMSGVLHSLREVGEAKYYSDRTIMVRVAVSLREVMPTEVIYQDSSATPRQVDAPSAISGGSTLSPQTAYTGLIIDARGTGVLPAMSPKVFDPEGKEVYGSAYVSREWAISQGIVGYLKDVNTAQGNDRVKGNPAVVKAVEARGAKKADLVLNKGDADTLRSIAQSQTFLREGRVIIILD